MVVLCNQKSRVIIFGHIKKKVIYTLHLNGDSLYIINKHKENEKDNFNPIIRYRNLMR